MPTINLPNNWHPRPYQQAAWDYLEGGGKRAALIWHRRSGKDSLALNWAATSAFTRTASYWHMLPMASQARKAIWTAVNPKTGVRLIDQAFPHAIRENTNEQEMFIRFKGGSTWQLVGSDNFDSLVGSPPAGIVFSEYALANPRAWAILRPILNENDGWAAFITTPRGRNHAQKILEIARSEPGWFGQVLTAIDTGVFTQESLDQELREYIKELGEVDGTALFRQEYLCSFEASSVGAYYGHLIEKAENEGRIGNVAWEPQIPVQTWWDLGIDDSTAIWFVQILGREIRLIDYYENSGVGLDHYAKVLKDKDYVYGQHMLPHDVQVHELSTGKSRFAFLAGLGIRGTVVRKHSVEDGINSVRSILPRCWFDKAKCSRGVEALRQYRQEWDDKGKAFRGRPLHDWSSHAADSFRYGAFSVRPAEVEWIRGVPRYINDAPRQQTAVME